MSNYSLKIDTPVTYYANHPDPITGKSGSNKSGDNFWKPPGLKLNLIATKGFEAEFDRYKPPKRGCRFGRRSQTEFGLTFSAKPTPEFGLTFSAKPTPETRFWWFVAIKLLGLDFLKLLFILVDKARVKGNTSIGRSVQ